MAVGFDNIDVPLHSKGITVTNTPGVLTETTAELGFTLMLTVARRIAEAKSMFKMENGKVRTCLLKDLSNANVGIWHGRDCKAFARRLLF